MSQIGAEERLAVRPAKRKKTSGSQEKAPSNAESPASIVGGKGRKDLAIGGDTKKAASDIVLNGSLLRHDTLSMEEDMEAEKPKQITKEKKKKKRSMVEAAGETHSSVEVDETEVAEQDKHQRLRSKFAKSTKRVVKAMDEDSGTTDHEEGEQLEKIEATGLVPLPQPAEVLDMSPKSAVSALPKWLSQPVSVDPDATVPFDQLSLSKSVTDHLSHAGFQTAFAVQSAVLSMLLPGPKQHRGDLCVSAATGSGKTLAYVLPIMEALICRPVARLRALIVVPTRELVTQIQGVFHLCGSQLKVGTAVGNKSLREERAALLEVFQKFDPDAHRKLEEEAKENGKEWAWLDESDDESDSNLPEPYCVVEYDSLVDVLICTPGRLVEHIRSTKGFTLEHLKWLVVDEADRLLDQSFQEWIDVVIPALKQKIEPNDRPFGQRHQWIPLRKIILSATMTNDFSKLTALDLHNPALVSLEGGDDLRSQNSKAVLEEAAVLLPANLLESAVAVHDAVDKPLYLTHLVQEFLGPQQDSTIDDDDDTSMASSSSSGLSSEEDSSMGSNSDSISSNDNSRSKAERVDAILPAAGRPSQASLDHSRGILIFTNTNENALRLCRLLTLLRPQWTPLISPLTKSTGTSSGRKTIAAFKKGKLSIVVASDRASRGLDLENLAGVINYDMPRSSTSYVHRVGRTARAGKSGTATTLVAHHEARWFWNEIGRSQHIKRSGKITRKDVQLDEITNGDRTKYEFALKQLGEEAKGSIG